MTRYRFRFALIMCLILLTLTATMSAISYQVDKNYKAIQTITNYEATVEYGDREWSKFQTSIANEDAMATLCAIATVMPKE